MAKKVCLAVIYNHQFPSNVDKLEKIYKGKFDKFWHIMPFYRGLDKRIIPVYENSYQFQGYIAQTVDKIYQDDFDYYIFMGDDVLLRPDFSNKTLEQILQINEDTSFIARNIATINNHLIITRGWLMTSLLNYIYNSAKEEIEKSLPDIDSMLQKYKSLKMPCNLLTENKIKFAQDYFGLQKLNNFFYKYKLENTPVNAKKLLAEYKEKDTNPKYLFPFAIGFSDFIVVPKKTVKKFAHYCGILAAARMFAEVAAPTALCISSDKITVPLDIGLKAINYSAVNEKRKTFPEKYGNSIKRILNEWDKTLLLMHPVKYSIWNIDI